MLNPIRAMKFATVAIACVVAVGCEQNPPATPAGGAAVPHSATPTMPMAHSTDAVLPPERDNSATNVRDRDGAALLPTDQNENKTDIGITANIRQQVVATEMSVAAQNVKIITQDGKVTLRGPVKTAEEKQRIEEMARSVAGADKVESFLEVAPE